MASAAPLGIVKRTESEFAEWAATERGFLQLFGRYQEEPIRFEGYQLAFLMTRSTYRSVEKARQVGYSWVFACEALTRCHLRDTQTSVFVSYNLSDAKEKIGYCQQMHEELPLEFQKRRVVDSKLEIAFASNSSKGKISRIISNPSKAPRGKKGDIYLDELAHCGNDRDIYKGSTALILRSSGQLTVCSSPLGRRGVFWEIARQEVKPYRAFWRQAVPWWLSSFLCKDVPKAAILAPSLPSAQRVERFGTRQIKDQFDSLMLEDFQQEFEVFYSDETLTFFPYELIIPCQEDELELAEDFADIAKSNPGRLVAGFDVGRRRDFSVLAIFEELKSGVLRCRLLKEFDRETFERQEAQLRAALTILPLARLSIDATGLGMNLAENLSREYPQVVSEDFTTKTKETWCNDFKILLQRKMVELPADRDLVAQIHSIKKTVTAGGRVIFDAEKAADTKGHADKFWAVALACQKERRPPPQKSASVGIRIVG
jgi:phage FluMu gp28-like protein